MENFSDIPGAPKAVGPYSVAVKTGNLYFLSGQIAIDPLVGKVVEGGTEMQAKQIFKNIDAVIAHLNLKTSNIVKSGIFLTDLSEFGAVNELYATWLRNHRPARSTVEVSGLPLGVSIEIEVILAV